MKLTDAIQPQPDEPCPPTATLTAQFNASNVWPQPASLVQPPDPFPNGRLIHWLRVAAQTRDSVEILTKAAAGFYLARHPTSLTLSNFAKAFGFAPAHLIVDIPIPTPHDDFATALADLSVTGRAAYASFSAQKPSESMLISKVQSRLAAAGLSVSAADVAAPTTAALDRAYAVAHALRGPVSARMSARAALRPAWIAVSGEDDPPHRPVNIESAPFPQYEIPVTVPGAMLKTAVQTRFFIASPDPPPEAPATPARSVPVDEVPHVPDGDQVILFIHGHTSSAEEALSLIKPLQQEGLKRGVRYSIIAFDFPNNGYSSTVNHTDVAPSAATQFPGGIFDGGPIATPILDFLEDFVVAFVDELDRRTPIKSRFAGVIGGSLGGNMGLRLGRRDLNAFPWLQRGIVSWSPASVWDPMIRDEFKRHAPEHCRDKWNEAENDNLPGPSSSRANYFREVFRGEIYDSNGSRQHPAEEIALVALTAAIAAFGPGAGLLIGAVTASQLMPPGAQPLFWYRDNWQDCKSFHILEAMVSREETYNANFRQWHWRVAGEQLVFSHVDRVDHWNASTPYRYELNRAPQLLAAGEGDNYKWSNIFDATRNLASLMSKTPGESLFLRNTGHSIHAERPQFFAHHIVDFLVSLSPVQHQPGWSSCSKCAALFFSSGPSVCAAGAGHDGSHSAGYSLVMDSTGDPGQHQWRSCNRCGSLFFSGNTGRPNLCPAGQQHDGKASSDYSLAMNVPTAPGEHGWRWCQKCAALFHSSAAANRCPAGQAHDGSASADYALPSIPRQLKVWSVPTPVPLGKETTITIHAEDLVTHQPVQGKFRVRNFDSGGRPVETEHTLNQPFAITLNAIKGPLFSMDPVAQVAGIYPYKEADIKLD
jgi:pimeloyl-ACP methyl ester carboxylesterase